jgi:hypothetical protein
MTDEKKPMSEEDLKALLDSVFKQPGGSRQIEWGDGYFCIVPLKDLKYSLERLQGMPPAKKGTVLASVKAYLDEHMPSVQAQTATQEVAMNCAQDVCIWFANEVLEGRQKLEETIQ